MDRLREQLFTSLTDTRSRKDAIRIWVPGCATGEKVYSRAFALTECLRRASLNRGRSDLRDRRE